MNHPYWIAYRTLVGKEVRRFSRIWVQTILPSAVTTALYFAIFGRLIGDRIGPMDGYAYIDFIVPGLILMGVITNAYANAVSSFYQAKFGHFVEELLVSPMPDWVVLAGYVSGAVARGLAVGAAVTAVALVFTEVHLYSLGVSLGILVLTAVLFGLAGFINAIYANSFDDISIIPTFVLTPLTYLGGVFYSIDLLGSPWRELSLGNPVLYMINAFRYGLLGVTDIPLWIAFGVVIAFILVLGAVALTLLHRGVGIKT